MKVKLFDILRYKYLIIIVLITALPSGTLLGFNVKIALVLLLLPLFVFSLLKYKLSLPKKTTFYVVFSIIILAIYTVYGSINYGLIAFKEAKLILTTIFLIFIVYVYHIKIFSKKDFFKLYTYSILLIFIIKLTAYIYSFGATPWYDSTEFYKTYFGAKIISMELPFNMIRIYVQTDIIAAFFPFVLTWSISNGIAKKSNIIFLVSLFLVLTSFSRYLIAIFIIGSMLHFYTLGKIKTMLLIIFPIIIVIVTLFYKEIYEFIELRLYSKANTNSDSIRDIQSIALLDLFWESPIFGKGIGAYSPSLIRSKIAPFSYEKQILSFLPKIGLVGMSLALTIFSYISYKFILKKDINMIIAFLLFVLSGWFNPYLYSSNVVLLYVFFMLRLDDYTMNNLSTINE